MSNYEERKQRKEWYLEECKKTTYEEPTIELLRKIFVSAELSEKTFDKDISEFNDTEAIDFLKSLNSKSRIRLKNTAWFLSRYRQWWYNKQNDYDILDPFDDRTIDKIVESIIPLSIINEQIINVETLKEYVEIEPDFINKFIIICPYYGIKGEDYTDILNLKMEDLDEETRTIRLISGRTANVDDYFIEHMKKANNTDTYITLQQKNNRNYKQTIYVKNGYIIRPTAARGALYDYKHASSQFINQRMAWIRKTIGNEYFTMTNLYKNGLINYIKKQYAKQDINFKTAIFQELNGKLYVHDKETQQYIDEFGSKMTVRMLRMQLQDTIQFYD